MRRYPSSCWASTHETTDTMPTSMLFRRELHMPCDLLFGASPNVVNLVDRQDPQDLKCQSHIISSQL
jgi:hypothetical protein